MNTDLHVKPIQVHPLMTQFTSSNLKFSPYFISYKMPDCFPGCTNHLELCVPPNCLKTIIKIKSVNNQRKTHTHMNSQSPSLSSPCMCGYLAINSKLHLSVAAVVSVPAENRRATENIEFFSL